MIEPSNNTIDKWCVNVSDIELPTYVTDVLKLGEKFNFNNPFNNSLTLHYLKDFEIFFNNNIDEEQIPKLKGTYLNFINKFYNRELSHITHFDKKFKIDLKKTKEFIKRNPQLLITRADKGNTIVIIRKLNYIEKTEKLFSDKKYYKQIKTNPLSSLERRSNDLIKLLNKNNFSGFGKKFDSVLQKSNIPKPYGLVKIHKDGFPIRPIMSAINSSLYNISKFFTQFLTKNLKKPSCHVDNSLILKEKINNLQIPPDFMIISLDVVSLFTNIPEYLVHKAIEKDGHSCTIK